MLIQELHIHIDISFKICSHHPTVKLHCSSIEELFVLYPQEGQIPVTLTLRVIKFDQAVFLRNSSSLIIINSL